MPSAAEVVLQTLRDEGIHVPDPLTETRRKAREFAAELDLQTREVTFLHDTGAVRELELLRDQVIVPLYLDTPNMDRVELEYPRESYKFNGCWLRWNKGRYGFTSEIRIEAYVVGRKFRRFDSLDDPNFHEEVSLGLIDSNGVVTRNYLIVTGNNKYVLPEEVIPEQLSETIANAFLNPTDGPGVRHVSAYSWVEDPGANDP